jgi:CubicO group peptidase (beta-lactamase class C family)
MMNIKRIHLFALLFFLPLLGNAQVSLRSDLKKILLDERDFSGVVLVAKEGKILFHESYGYRKYDQHIRLKKNDVFELASLSKQFTAGIIMMLQEEGKLQYDDPVDKYLAIPYRNITIRHLLNHTSGLPDYQEIMDRYWDKTKVAGNPEIIEYLNRYAPPARFIPGEKYEYSNTGYVLLASIAEKASGLNFIDMCKTRIFGPLGMAETDIRTLSEKSAKKNFAAGHVPVKNPDRFVRADSFPSSNYTIWLGNRKGPGRISSNATDLLKWDQALYSEKLFKRASLEAAWSPARLNGGDLSPYGFGWMLKWNESGEKVVWHSGDNPGYMTRIFRYTADRKTIIVLCNNAYERFEPMMKKLESAVLKH